MSRHAARSIAFIITENHSFDNYFGCFPGADGATAGRTSTGAVVPLAEAPAQVSPDLSHSARQGYGDDTTYDFASLLSFVEKRFGLRPLTSGTHTSIPAMALRGR